MTVDEVGVVLAEVLVTESPLVHLADAEVLDEDVRLFGEFSEDFPALLGGEVQRYRALVPVDAQIVRRLVGVTVGRWLPTAGLVATVGSLDFDHVCAQVPELHRTERARENPGGIQHRDPL